MTVLQKFYITLPSNVKSDEYVESNTITKYKTSLSKRLDFLRNEKWEVGLAEINYTKSWYNVKENIKFQFFSQSGAYIESPTHFDVGNITRHEGVPVDDIDDFLKNFDNNLFMYSKPGHYKSPRQLCDVINEEFLILKGICDKIPKLIFNEFDYNITIEAGICKDIVFFPDLGKEIETILGLIDDENLTLKEKTKINYFNINPEYIASPVIYSDALQAFGTKIFKSYRPVDINAGFNSLYVYSNIVEHTCVGNSFVQLLRAVEVPNSYNFGEQINIIYDKPHFIPLQTNCIDIIEIDIRDDTFENIPFQFGRVTIKLLFQKYE